MFDDGLALVIVDFSLLATGGLALLFLALYVTLVRFERSMIGRLIAGNAIAWLLVCAAGIAYRLGEHGRAPWLLLPVAVAVPVVLAWWIVSLVRSRHDPDRLMALVKEWQDEAWELSANGRSGEAQLAYEHARALRRAIGQPTGPTEETP